MSMGLLSSAVVAGMFTGILLTALYIVLSYTGGTPLSTITSSNQYEIYAVFAGGGFLVGFLSQIILRWADIS